METFPNDMCDNLTVPPPEETSDIEDQQVPRLKKSNFDLCGSPISALMEYCQCKPNLPTITWKEFNRNGLFGCQISLGDKFWITPAEHYRKKEARNMVAVMACIELLGNKFKFENVDLIKYENWTKEDVRALSDRLFKEINSSMQTEDNSETKLENVLESVSIDHDSNKPYLSIVNEACQKGGIPLPNYECLGENCGGITRYRCIIREFNNFPDFCSNIHPSKKAAKNEAAKYLYVCLMKESKPKAPSIQYASSSSSSKSFDYNADLILFEKLQTDITENPKLLMPFLMLILTHLSSSSHPGLSSIDAIYESCREWEKFQEWKEMNYNEI